MCPSFQNSEFVIGQWNGVSWMEFLVMQLCTGQLILQREHAIKVRSFAKEAAAPPALKGDGESNEANSPYCD